MDKKLRASSFILVLTFSFAVNAQKTKSAGDAAAKQFPNTVLLTQDNKPVHFYEDLLKDKTVVINFMFTTCTAICPPMTATLARVQRLLGEHLESDVRMISISVDPVTDTPELLKAYAAKFRAQPGWYFLTGEKANVDSVLKVLEAYVENKNDHTPMLIIGNVKTGNWSKIYALSTPQDIATKVTNVLAGTKD